MIKVNKAHLFTLDSLRGIAALAVCLFHFTGVGLPKLTYEPLKNAFSWGWLGVEIFFVISGFIIPYVLLKSNYTLKDFGAFIGKRFVRICPPSYIILLLSLLQFYVIDHYLHPAHPWLAQVSVPATIHNFLYTVTFTNYSWFNGVFWTLAVEFQFYIFIGLVFSLMFKNIWTYLLSCIVVGALYYLPFAEQAQFLHYSSLFLIGGATLMFFERRISRTAYLLLLAGLAVLTYFQAGLLPMLFGIATALVIAFVQFRSRVGTFLGNISYSLYLSHFLIGSSLEAAVVKVLPVNTVAGRVTGQLLCLTGTIIGAYLFYRFVEAYFINLANHLFRKKKSAVAPLPVTIERTAEVPQPSDVIL
jgi:peptidoglycan/LPS O-acetylase OafA/YrhL